MKEKIVLNNSYCREHTKNLKKKMKKKKKINKTKEKIEIILKSVKLS